MMYFISVILSYLNALSVAAHTSSLYRCIYNENKSYQSINLSVTMSESVRGNLRCAVSQCDL